MQSLRIFIALCIAVLAISCNQHTEATADPNAITDSVMKTIQTAPVKDEVVTETIKLYGKIQPNEGRQAKVYALVSGKISDIKVEMGDYVQKDQALAILQSSEVAGISNDLALAQANVEMTKKNMETTKELYEGNLATQKDYISTQVDYNKALSELSRAQQVHAITGGSNSIYEIKSPVSGYIIEKNITNNSEVRSDNSNDLFAIADLSNVWIIANVYESDINNVHTGDTVLVSTLASPGKEYKGRIDKIYSVLDPANRTMKVRISMNNPNNELKPEMFATVAVKGKPTGKMLSIPSQAIVLDNSKNYVVVKNGKGLSIKEVQLIQRVDNKAFISGLTPGEQVVTNSQVFLYEALNNK